MYICDSDVVVTGVSSIIQEDVVAPCVHAKTLEAIRDISNRFEQVPADRLERAFRAVQHNHDYHFHV